MKSPHESDGHQLPIVLADDEAETILLVKTHLRKAGYTTYTCGNGRDALNLVTEHNPAILLADWMMPEPTGVELCRKLRASPSYDLVYSILVTANDDPNQIATGLDAGADDYLIKPVRAPVLLARVRLGERVLRLRMRQNEHARELESEIAERRQVERELREAKETAESAIDALQESVHELEAFNKLAVNRELRMIELKQEINDLCVVQGDPRKYVIVDEGVPA